MPSQGLKSSQNGPWSSVGIARRSPGELEVVAGAPDGGRIADLNGMASAFAPE
jgi:hypothetical protein